MLKTALEYEKRGFSVIPVQEGKKEPLVKWLEFQKRRATPEEITNWWTKNPKANIGIVTGKISNLFVIDIDSEEGQQNILKYIPETLITPTVDTPGGGQHLYFKYPEGQNITIGAGKIKGTDFRGENGYICAPPSVNGTGKAYKWVLGLDTVLAELPAVYINYLNIYMHRGEGESFGSVTKEGDGSVTKRDIWENGVRDENLFHVAHCLTLTQNDKEYIRQTLRAIMLSWGETDEGWLEVKIKSALDRAERKERNIQAEVDNFISVTTGSFSVTDCDKECGFVTKRDKTTRRQCFHRRVGDTIEKYGNKDGWYIRISGELEYINFDEDEPIESEYPVKLGLGLNDIAEVSEGNIILIAGDFNAGKTTFLLNVLKDNKNKLPIRYISSEMKKSEFKKRFLSFSNVPFKFWLQDEMTQYIKKSADFYAAINPMGVNIIDFLEFKDSEYYRGAEYMTQIHDRLTTGIAVVAVQKKEGQRMPRAGDALLEKPRLAVAFSKKESSDENPQGVCEILKCKMPKLGKIDGKKLRFEITDKGSRFHVLNSWGYYKGMF